MTQTQLHPNKKSIITIHYDYIIGNEVPHFVGKELMKKDESFATNCLEFFCFDSPVKEVIILKADGSFISRNQLLTNKGIYITKEIRVSHNIHKMLLADSFSFRTIRFFKNYSIDLPEAIGNLVWRSQKSYVELCGPECAILDSEGVGDEIAREAKQFPDIVEKSTFVLEGIPPKTMDKTTLVQFTSAYSQHKTPPQPICGQESERKVTTLTLPSGKTIELKAPTKESIDLLWNKFEGISEGMSEEDKTYIQKVMERRGIVLDIDTCTHVSNWKLDTIATLQMIQAYIIDNYSKIQDTKIYDSKEIENITLHWNKDMMSDKDENGNHQTVIDVWIKLDIGILICNRKPLHTFAEYIELIINQIKNL